jgi:hypothetical protein
MKVVARWYRRKKGIPSFLIPSTHEASSESRTVFASFHDRSGEFLQGRKGRYASRPSSTSWVAFIGLAYPDNKESRCVFATGYNEARTVEIVRLPSFLLIDWSRPRYPLDSRASISLLSTCVAKRNRSRSVESGLEQSLLPRFLISSNLSESRTSNALNRRYLERPQ